MKKIAFIVLVLSFAVSCKTFHTYDLTCEGLYEPLGIDSLSPHFSWKISSGTEMSQYAWQIQVATSVEELRKGKSLLWDSGRMDGDSQIMVTYGGVELESGRIYHWRVRVWRSENEVSSWSAPQRFSVGKTAPVEMEGEYIGCVPGEGRSAILRKTFRWEGRGTALLYVNSLGYHEAYINGRRVGEAVLSPAVSQLDKRSLIITYDVSDLLRRGDNDLVLWTGTGWFKNTTFGNPYGGALVRAELDECTPEGPRCVVSTDTTWQGAFSGYRDLGSWRPLNFGGEEIDARIVPSSLDRAGLEKLGWGPVDSFDSIDAEAVQQMCEPCVVQETLEAVSIIKDDRGRWIADFGRVVNALVDIRLPKLPEGHQITVSFSDDVSEKGEYDIQSRNILISSGKDGGDMYIGRFNHHVVRCAVFEGLPDGVAPVEVRARRMRTAYSARTTFECSDPDLQNIHDLVAGTMENLAFNGYMVDCANLERLGYGGDGNASTLSLQTLFDVGPLYLNWLTAWSDVMRSDGALPHTAPSPYQAGGGPYWCSFPVQASWRTYMSFGDSRPMERFYSVMQKWFCYVDSWTEDGLLRCWPDECNRIWCLGDWLAPSGVDVSAQQSVDLVNNCTVSQSFASMASMAAALGKDGDARYYRDRQRELNRRIHEEFFNSQTCTYATGSQLDMSYPLLVGAVPDSLCSAVKGKLIERTSDRYNNHLAVGLVGVPILTEWATLSGEVDFMYGMLKQKDYPGYLNMLANGATGVWESWDGSRSRLHNCYNGIESWFYQALGGIIPLEPGFKKVLVAPQIPKGLSYVRVIKQTPYGPLEVEWHSADGKVSLDVKEPVGVTVVFPGEDR